MSTLTPSISSFKPNASAWRWRLTATIARIGLAWRLATNRLTPRSAFAIDALFALLPSFLFHRCCHDAIP